MQGNHVHLLVEAQDEKALSRGMNGLGVRVAKGLNRVMRRHGKVLDDRLFTWSLPAIVVGIVVGRLFNRRLEADRFRRLVHVGLMVVAVVLLLQTRYFVIE